jgi:hypothetical protein
VSIAIPQRFSTDGAVWAIPKVTPGTAQCVGNQFDSFGNHIQDGPACLVVRAADQLGNRQVSRVLHVCIDHDNDGAECASTAVDAVQGGKPVQVDVSAGHGLQTGDRVLLGGLHDVFEANGVWTVTVVSATRFTLDGSDTPTGADTGAHFLRWTSSSDCTGTQTSLDPVVVDATKACTPWRLYSRGEHLDIE